MSDEIQKKWRMFCAIDLPEELKSRVAAYAKHLSEAFPQPRVSWERPEKLHLTLKFVGEIKAARVEELSSAAARAASLAKPFDLALATPGAFPPQGAARVLWLGIRDDSGLLSNLQRSLEDECYQAGFGREPRAFNPHLTIARIRSPRGARELAGAHRETIFEPQVFKVSELLVMRSELGPGGSRYSIVSRHTLQNSV